MACALLSPARRGRRGRPLAIVLCSPRPAQATTARAGRHALRAPDDALASAFPRLAGRRGDPGARAASRGGAGVGRYLRDAAGGGRDAMSVGTVNACRNRRRGQGGPRRRRRRGAAARVDPAATLHEPRPAPAEG